jgi:hypothetical protein
MRHALSIGLATLVLGAAFTVSTQAQVQKSPTGCTASCKSVAQTYSCNAEGASAKCDIDNPNNKATCTDGTTTTTCNCAGASPGCTTK